MSISELHPLARKRGQRAPLLQAEDDDTETVVPQLVIGKKQLKLLRLGNHWPVKAVAGEHTGEYFWVYGNALRHEDYRILEEGGSVYFAADDQDYTIATTVCLRFDKSLS